MYLTFIITVLLYSDKCYFSQDNSLKEIISRGLIGEIFHIECGSAGYGHPGFWWRSDKKISGGQYSSGLSHDGLIEL